MLDAALTGMEANSEPPRPVIATLPSEVNDWKPSPARETVNEFGVNTAEPLFDQLPPTVKLEPVDA